GEREYTEALTGVALERLTDLGAVCVADRPVTFSGANRRAAREQFQRCSLCVVPELAAGLLVERGHPLEMGIEVEHTLTPGFALALGFGYVTAELLGREQQRALGRVTDPEPVLAFALEVRVVAPDRGPQQAIEQRGRLRARGVRNRELVSVNPYQ